MQCSRYICSAQLQKRCDDFFVLFNSLYPSFRFPFEKECNGSLPFLDVLVEKSEAEFISSVYKEPTFTGQYLRWNSLCPSWRKTNLINPLIHRALMICSNCKLQRELDNIRLLCSRMAIPITLSTLLSTIQVKRQSKSDKKAIMNYTNLASRKTYFLVMMPCTAELYISVKTRTSKRRTK